MQKGCRPKKKVAGQKKWLQAKKKGYRPSKKVAGQKERLQAKKNSCRPKIMVTGQAKRLQAKQKGCRPSKKGCRPKRKVAGQKKAAGQKVRLQTNEAAGGSVMAVNRNAATNTDARSKRVQRCTNTNAVL